MKLKVDKDKLYHHLNIVSRAVGLKASLPVLNNILLDTQNGQLKLAATNLETSITTSLAVQEEESGTITIPARLLAEFVNTLPNGTVLLKTSEESLLVSSGQYEATFAGIAATEFPKPPEFTGLDKTLLDKSFGAAVTQTSFAASTDEGRPVLTGILLEFSKNNLNLVATDGYRLAKKTLKVDSDLELNLLIPARALNEVARLINDAEGEAEISFQPVTANNQALFIIGQCQVTTRLLDGSFPNYQTIIPTSSSTRILLGTQELTQAVKATSLFARDLGNVVNLTTDPEKNEVSLHANTAQVGTGKSQLKASVEGEKTTIAFNSHYLASGLNVVGSTQVTLEINDSNKPALLRPVGESNFFYIIMPVRQQG